MFQYSEGDVSSLDAFQSIMTGINPIPGELVLVAGGFLGKLICERVRERGGIALDIGSAADYWMGFQTRSYGRNQTIFDPSSSLIDGQPFEDRFGSGPVSNEKPCHSDLGRNINLTGHFSPEILWLHERPTLLRPLRVVGHPRCGSGYVSQVFQRLGVQIGHERLGEHGICSWMHAVEDVSMPYASPSVSPEAFRLTLAYVRDPIDAIPSIMLENTRSKSFDFRRFHIYRLLGLDIAKSRDPFERAVRSYLAWTRIVELQSPVATLRVEHIMDDLGEYISELSKVGLEISLNTLAAATGVPTDVNRSSDKFAIPKPAVDISQYESLPPDLRHELATFCERYGYSVTSLDELFQR
jgi:hypothetical protein